MEPAVLGRGADALGAGEVAGGNRRGVLLVPNDQAGWLALVIDDSLAPGLRLMFVGIHPRCASATAGGTAPA